MEPKAEQEPEQPVETEPEPKAGTRTKTRTRRGFKDVQGAVLFTTAARNARRIIGLQGTKRCVSNTTDTCSSMPYLRAINDARVLAFVPACLLETFKRLFKVGEDSIN